MQRNQSRIADYLERIANVLSTEDGRPEINITRQSLNIPVRPKNDKQKYKGVDV